MVSSVSKARRCRECVVTSGAPVTSWLVVAVLGVYTVMCFHEYSSEVVDEVDDVLSRLGLYRCCS